MNLVGALGRSFFEIPNSFQKHREKPKKKYRKTGIFTQNQILKNSILDIDLTLKLIITVET